MLDRSARPPDIRGLLLLRRDVRQAQLPLPQLRAHRRYTGAKLPALWKNGTQGTE